MRSSKRLNKLHVKTQKLKSRDFRIRGGKNQERLKSPKVDRKVEV